MNQIDKDISHAPTDRRSGPSNSFYSIIAQVFCSAVFGLSLDIVSARYPSLSRSCLEQFNIFRIHYVSANPAAPSQQIHGPVDAGQSSSAELSTSAVWHLLAPLSLCLSVCQGFLGRATSDTALVCCRIHRPSRVVGQVEWI